MPIIRAHDTIERFRVYAQHCDFNMLGCRSAEMNRRVAEAIVPLLDVRPEDAVVDVGCGEGTLLQMLEVRSKVGILPTREEIERVKAVRPNLDVRQGVVQAIPLADGMADKVLCNSVLIALTAESEVARALAELARIAAPGGLVFVGEIPHQALNINFRRDSIARWLIDLLMRGGIRTFLAGVKDIAAAAVSGRVFIVHPEEYFHAAREPFIALAASCGLDLVSDRMTPHASDRRDYLFRRRADAGAKA